MALIWNQYVKFEGSSFLWFGRLDIMVWERDFFDMKQFCHLAANSSLMISSFSANKDTLMAILMQCTREDNCDLVSFTASYTM